MKNIPLRDNKFAHIVSVSIAQFGEFFFFYIRKKIMRSFLFMETHKNMLVKFFMMKRGRYNRPFLHITTLGVLGIGVLIAPFLAETYPIFSSHASMTRLPSPANQEQSIVVDTNVFQTDISQKTRDKIIKYTAERGDTLSTIAKKFGISVDTLKWGNDLADESVAVGQTLNILPVTGIAHKVVRGDSVYTIAKKYDSDPQKIVDFPFNDFVNSETFSLVEGQVLVVPDGVKPAEQQYIKKQVYYAQGPVPVVGGGVTWPVHGIVTQFASWYHMALDIAAPVGTPIVAGSNGTVTRTSIGSYDQGYGTNMFIDNGNGLTSHYAHMSGISVNVGDSVVAGKTVIGWIGLTGRTTGPHVHFEIRKNGVLVDPLGYLQ